LATGALAPLAARRLNKAAAGHPALLARQPERRGQVPEAQGELWIHTASVGELNAVEALVRALRDEGHRIVLTTQTHTAALEFKARFGATQNLRHLFAPLDTQRCVNRWLDRTRPRALLLVETEIWPVLLEACRRRSIPVAMVNARISARALKRFLRFTGLFRAALSTIDRVLCQEEAERARFSALGVTCERIEVTGNLKFDAAALRPVNDEMRGWQQRWSGRRTWVAGSTHAGEEDQVGAAHLTLLRRYPDALLVMVPRHPERGTEALAALQRQKLNAWMIDACSDKDLAKTPVNAQLRGAESQPVQAIVVDRMGMLGGLYQIADACFVGGSLIDGIGGHNLLEPALAGKPIVTGIHTADQRAAAEGLEAAGGLVRVDSDTALAVALAKIFDQPEFARQLAANAGVYAGCQRGALDRTLKALNHWLFQTD